MPDYLTDEDLEPEVSSTPFDRPDFVGLVSGAQYKLDIADGVTEFALAILQGGDAWLFEMSSEDLRYLARQITALVGK